MQLRACAGRGTRAAQGHRIRSTRKRYAHSARSTTSPEPERLHGLAPEASFAVKRADIERVKQRTIELAEHVGALRRRVDEASAHPTQTDSC
jgi:hypothetical protein